MSKNSTDLVRPGDITDAADSTDLLEQLRLSNTTRVEDNLDIRTRAEMRKDREREIRTTYNAKAADYYNGLWSRCGESKVGHSFTTLDVGGYSLYVCGTCSFARGKLKKDYTGNSYPEDHGEKEYNQTQVNNLAKQMMELDEKGGILEWPQDDDFIGLENKYREKKRWWN